MRKIFNRYCIVALNGMTMGLFCSLIIGLIIKQIGSYIPNEVISHFMIFVGETATVMMGAAIGIGVARSLEASNRVTYSAGAVGLFCAQFTQLQGMETFAVSGPGDPVAALIGALVAVEIGILIDNKTFIDLIVVPFVVIVSGCIVGAIVGPIVSDFMALIGSFVNAAVAMQPMIMGAIIALIVGLVLVSPMSSAALCIMLGLGGLAAGAATVGCAAQMTGFAICSLESCGWNGFFSMFFGTSKIQLPNIMKKPRILIPTMIASLVCGALSATVFAIQTIPGGAGMGTSGLVGFLTSFETMTQLGSDPLIVLISLVIVMMILPVIISYFVYKFMKTKRLITAQDYYLDLK